MVGLNVWMGGNFIRGSRHHHVVKAAGAFFPDNTPALPHRHFPQSFEQFSCGHSVGMDAKPGQANGQQAIALLRMLWGGQNPELTLPI